MDDAGNILIKRISKSNVYIKYIGHPDETSIGSEILKSPNHALEPGKAIKVFTMIYCHNSLILPYLVIRYETIPRKYKQRIT